MPKKDCNWDYPMMVNSSNLAIEATIEASFCGGCYKSIKKKCG